MVDTYSSPFWACHTLSDTLPVEGAPARRCPANGSDNLPCQVPLPAFDPVTMQFESFTGRTAPPTGRTFPPGGN